MASDWVIPLYECRWITRAVVEGVCRYYSPGSLHIITLPDEKPKIEMLSKAWELGTTSLYVHDESIFFPGQPKDKLLTSISLEGSLYQPGWFYQQLLKLGAFEGIPSLSDPYMVWDSDLLPLDTWPAEKDGRYYFSLLQHIDGGNPEIVSKWESWIEDFLKVTVITDPVSTFIPHHMWFFRDVLQELHSRVHSAFPDEPTWQSAMLRSVATHETFAEYWSYSSLANRLRPDSLNYYPYAMFGETTERFFDDGTQPFGQGLAASLGRSFDELEAAPCYEEILTFVRHAYDPDRIPSSIAFEANPRHLKKDESTLHVEETRSRWNSRMTQR